MTKISSDSSSESQLYINTFFHSFLALLSLAIAHLFMSNYERERARAAARAKASTFPPQWFLFVFPLCLLARTRLGVSWYNSSQFRYCSERRRVVALRRAIVCKRSVGGKRKKWLMDCKSAIDKLWKNELYHALITFLINLLDGVFAVQGKQRKLRTLIQSHY